MRLVDLSDDSLNLVHLLLLLSNVINFGIVYHDSGPGLLFGRPLVL